MGASFMSIINIFETKKCKCKNPKRILCTRFCGVCFKILSLHKNCIKILPKKFYKKLDKSLTGKDRTRELARIRDKHTCQKCGKIWQEGQRRFDVHHLNGKCGEMSKEYDKVSEINGLITLCHKCHFNRHDWAPKVKSLLINSLSRLSG